MTQAANGMHYTGSKALYCMAAEATPVAMTLAEGTVLTDSLVGGEVNVQKAAVPR